MNDLNMMRVPKYKMLLIRAFVRERRNRLRRRTDPRLPLFREFRESLFIGKSETLTVLSLEFQNLAMRSLISAGSKKQLARSVEFYWSINKASSKFKYHFFLIYIADRMNFNVRN